jgi:hypothetical protein
VPRHVALRCNVVRLYALQRGALCCNVVRLYALQRDAMYCVRCNIGCGRESTLQRLGRHRAAPSTHAHGPQYPEYPQYPQYPPQPCVRIVGYTAPSVRWEYSREYSRAMIGTGKTPCLYPITRKARTKGGRRGVNMRHAHGRHAHGRHQPAAQTDPSKQTRVERACLNSGGVLPLRKSST